MAHKLYQAERASVKPGGKRIVLTTFGSLGDLYPYLAIALELKARGHRVLIAANASHRHSVEAEGIDFYAVRPDVGDLGSEPDVMKKVLNLRSGPEYVVRRLLMPYLRDSYDDLTAACAGADLLVTHPLTFAAPLVVEKKQAQGLLSASVAIAPSLFLSAYDPPVLAPLPGLNRLRVLGPGVYRMLLRALTGTTRRWLEPWRELRAELGLPPTDANLMLGELVSPELVLATFSSAMAAPQPDWPAQTVQTGFPFYDGSAHSGLDPALSAFLDAGEPPLVFTLGSSAVLDAGGFYAESAEAAQRLGRRALLLVGRDPRNRPAKLPEGVAAFDYAPYSLVFPRAAAIIHQGGIGTTAQALRAGVPMLVVPFGFDQPDNAARVTRLGAARTLARRRYTAARVEGELRALLTAPYARKAAEVSRIVRAERGASAACDALEALWNR